MQIKKSRQQDKILSLTGHFFHFRYNTFFTKGASYSSHLILRIRHNAASRHHPSLPSIDLTITLSAYPPNRLCLSTKSSLPIHQAISAYPALTHKITPAYPAWTHGKFPSRQAGAVLAQPDTAVPPHTLEEARH